MTNSTLSAAYGSGDLTVTLNNPPSSGGPTTANLSLFGTSLSAAFDSTWQATFRLKVHPSILGSTLIAMASASGQSSGVPPIAAIGVQLGEARGPVFAVQVVPPATSGAPYLVAPTQRAILRAYYSGLLSQSTALSSQTAQAQALYVMSSLVLHVLADKIIPSLQSSTYSPITLSADESNALSDLTTNVIPTLTQTLGTIYPSGGNPTAAYAETKAAAPLYQQALAAYEADLATIPNLS